VIALVVAPSGGTARATATAIGRDAYLASKDAELKHYVDLAARAIAHLSESGRDDARIKEEAIRILAR